MTLWKHWLRSLAVSALTTFVLIVVFSLVLYRFRLGNEVLVMLNHVIYLVASFVGAFLLGKRLHTRRFLWGIAFGALYLAITLLISWTQNGALPASFLLHTALCLGGGMIGGMVS